MLGKSSEDASAWFCRGQQNLPGVGGGLYISQKEPGALIPFLMWFIP